MAASFCSTRRIALAFAATILVGGMLSVTAMAEDLGPAVGIKAPDIGTRLDQTGRPQLIDVNGGVEEITKRGYQVAGLSYDSPEILQTFTTKRHIAYTLLSDPKSEVIDLYRLRDPQYPSGSKAYGVPRPIIFVVGTDGVIRAKLYEESFKVRPPVTAVISKLDELGKGS